MSRVGERRDEEVREVLRRVKKTGLVSVSEWTMYKTGRLAERLGYLKPLSPSAPHEVAAYALTQEGEAFLEGT